jgi:hypothetical protein
MNADTVQWAYVVGGEPKTFRSIQPRLLKLGVNVAGKVDYNVAHVPPPPKSTTFILLFTDEVKHRASDAARQWASDRDLPIVAGPAASWATMETRIRSRELTGPEIKPAPEFVNTQLAEALKKATEATEASPSPEPQKEEESVPAKTTHPRQARAQRIEAACKQVFESYKGELTQFTNYDAVPLVLEILGERDISPSTIAAYRKKLGFPLTPKGFKRPGIRGKGGHRRPAEPTGKKVPVQTSAQKDQAEKDFDVIQSMLDEWVLKHTIGKLYCAFEQGEWQVNWDQLKVVTHEKVYRRKQ